MKNIVVDGISVEVDEKDAQIIERFVGKITADLATAVAAAKQAGEDHAAQVTTLTQERDSARAEAASKEVAITTLKQELADSVVGPDKLEKLVRERSDTITKAKTFLGDKLVHEGRSDADMRKQVVLSKMGDTAKAWNDEQIKISFDTLTATAPGGGAASAGQGSTDPGFRAAAGNPASVSDVYAKVDQAWAERDQAMRDAWKTPSRQSH